MQNIKQPIGIFGGTFDPIHYGHLRLALELYQQLQLQEIRFMPCHTPVLDKTAQISPAQRLHLLKLAVANQPGFVIDERELQRPTPSYTVETLISLRQEVGTTPLALIVGADAFADLPRWHRWQEIITLTHLIVIPRPEFILTDAMIQAALPPPAQIIQDRALLAQAPAGYVLFPKITALTISSTNIRSLIQQGQSPRYLLPDAVWQWIQQEKLYDSLHVGQ